MMEFFWGAIQLELIGTKAWQIRDELAGAIFEWTEYWYSPKRRQSGIGMHSHVTFETLHVHLSASLPQLGGVFGSGS